MFDRLYQRNGIEPLPVQPALAISAPSAHLQVLSEQLPLQPATFATPPPEQVTLPVSTSPVPPSPVSETPITSMDDGVATEPERVAKEILLQQTIEQVTLTETTNLVPPDVSSVGEMQLMMANKLGFDYPYRSLNSPASGTPVGVASAPNQVNIAQEETTLSPLSALDIALEGICSAEQRDEHQPSGLADQESN